MPSETPSVKERCACKKCKKPFPSMFALGQHYSEHPDHRPKNAKPYVRKTARIEDASQQGKLTFQTNGQLVLHLKCCPCCGVDFGIIRDSIENAIMLQQFHPNQGLTLKIGKDKS